MKIIFARHGETEANLANKFQGRIDTPLTELGKHQAANLGKFIQNNTVDLCFLSPLSRVLATYEIATKHLTIPYYIEEQLIEVCYGEWEGVVKETIDQTIFQKREATRFTFVYPGSFHGIPGESYAIQYHSRMKLFLEKLITTYPNKTILIIAHQGSILSARKFFQKLTDEDTGIIKTLNNEILICEATTPDHYKVTLKSL